MVVGGRMERLCDTGKPGKRPLDHSSHGHSIEQSDSLAFGHREARAWTVSKCIGIVVVAFRPQVDPRHVTAVQNKVMAALQ